MSRTGWQVFIVSIAVTTISRGQKSDFRVFPWRWRCDIQSGICHRTSKSQGGGREEGPLFSLDGCRSCCGSAGSLWPLPETVSLSRGQLTDINLKGHLNVENDDTRVKNFLNGSWDIFQGYFDHKGVEKDRPLQVNIKVRRSGLQLDLDSDVSYELSVESKPTLVSVHIRAETVFGARNGLETLSQLITYDDSEHKLQVVSEATIIDAPRFKYRGLLLDSGRNFFPLSSLRRMIEGMAQDKMNVFHWHMNEQHSFPFVSRSQPNLTRYGAYSEKEVYHPSDIQALVTFAHQRGVILLPEFDAPAHASRGWEWGSEAGKGELDWTTMSAEPNSGQLNPLNPAVYEILEDLYADLLRAFSTDDQKVPLFHMGGDEVNFNCWRRSEDIMTWMEKKGLPPQSIESFLELWNLFQSKALARLINANGGKRFKHNVMVWTSEMAKPKNIVKYLPPDEYVIQVWCRGSDPWIKDLLDKKYRLVFSNSDTWYLDCGFDAWVWDGRSQENNWCSPYKGWKTMYENSPRHLVNQFGVSWKNNGEELVWGGEAAMWSEQVDANGVMTRIWPRLSAVAERLWSDPDTGWKEAEDRLAQHRHRMVQRGIDADVLWPEFCRQNQGWCYKLAEDTYQLSSADFPIDEDNQQRQQYQLHEHRDGLRQDDLKELQLRKKDPIHRPTSLPSGFIGEPLPVAPQSTQPAPKSLFTAIYQGTVLLVVALIAWRGLRVGTKWIMTHVTPKTRGTRNSGISA